MTRLTISYLVLVAMTLLGLVVLQSIAWSGEVLDWDQRYYGTHTRRIEQALDGGAYTVHLVTGANAAVSVTPPAGANVVKFYSDAAFYVDFNGTAAVPGASITDGSASEWSPTVRLFDSGAEISVVTPVDGRVELQFWRVQ